MRVVVDTGLCQGHGVCETEAPDVFKVDKDTNVVEILDPNPPANLHEAVRAAVKYCPTQALSMTEEE